MIKKIVGYLALGIFLICIGVYIEGAISLVNKHADTFDKYPTVFVGVGAAFVALLGVIISQIWQTANMNENIKANKENIEKQLDKQQEALQKQFSEQRNLLTKQNDHTLILEERKLEATKIENRYEEEEKDRREFWLILLKLKRLLKSYLEKTENVSKNHIEQRSYETVSKMRYQGSISLLEKSILENLDQIGNIRDEIELIEHTIDYFHNVKNLGDEESFLIFKNTQFQFMEFARDVAQASLKYCQNFSNDQLIEENLSKEDADVKINSMIEKGNERLKEITTQIWDAYYSDANVEVEEGFDKKYGYEYAYNNLLESIKRKTLNQ